MSTALATTPAPEPAIRMANLLTRYNLHPEADLHPSWLPAAWPAAHRQVARFGEAGLAVLSDWLRRRLPGAAHYDAEFESARKRLALLDGRALRLLAVYCGFGTHRALLRHRHLGPVLRRQLQRYEPGALAFAMDRMPDLPAFEMNNAVLVAHPAGAGRVLVWRGARLLLALLAQDGPAVTERTRQKLPRHVSAGDLPMLTQGQLQQLEELVQLSIVPERLSSWHWLF